MDRLNAGDQIPINGGSLTSADGRYSLVMQGDGNLVLYHVSDGVALWASNTYGRAISQCVMQGDGNFVIYGYPVTKAFWASGTWHSPGASLVLQSDGNLVIYDANGKAVWASGTAEQVIPLRGVGFGPDGEAEGIAPQNKVAIHVRANATVVVSCSFASVHETAMLIYPHPRAQQNSKIAERGNYSRDGSLWVWKNDTGAPQHLALTGWHKRTPPNGREPWTQHLAVGFQVMSSSPTQTHQGCRFDEVGGGPGAEMSCLITMQL